MRNKFLLLSSVALLLLSGCGSKQYYTPETVQSGSSLSSSDTIVAFSRDSATLSSGTVLTKTKVLKLNLEDGYRYINGSSRGVIVANKEGKCKILTGKTAQEVVFPKALIAGTIIGNNLVYILQDNNFGLYDLAKKSVVFNDKAEKVFSIDTRVSNPLQIENLVVIPLLNGKLNILDLKTHKIVKEIFVSTESVLNNVIFLKRFKNTLIAATPHALISVNNQGRREFKRAISEVAIDDKNIFVFAKDGIISKLDASLTVQEEKKFKFAHFSISTLYKDKVYAMDKQGYMVVSNKDFTKHKVYEFPEVDEYSFVSTGKLYYDGNIIDLNTLNYE